MGEHTIAWGKLHVGVTLEDGWKVRDISDQQLRVTLERAGRVISFRLRPGAPGSNASLIPEDDVPSDVRDRVGRSLALLLESRMGDSPPDPYTVVLGACAPERGWRVAELGCGDGKMAAMLATVVGPTGVVAGFDVDLTRAEPFARSVADVGARTWCRLSLGDIQALPLREGSLDLLVLHLSFHFGFPWSTVPEAMASRSSGEIRRAAPEALRMRLADLLRRLRPGGRLVICDYDPEPASEDGRRGARLLASDGRTMIPPAEVQATLSGLGVRVERLESWKAAHLSDPAMVAKWNVNRLHLPPFSHQCAEAVDIHMWIVVATRPAAASAAPELEG